MAAIHPGTTGEAEVTRSVRDDGTIILSRGPCRALLRHLGSGLFVSKYEGKCLGAFVAPTTSAWEEAMAQGHKLLFFADCRGLNSYETSYRRDITRWIRANLDRCDGFHLLTNHEIVRMGINVANLVIRGSVKAHSDAGQFEAEIRRHDPAFAGLDRW